MDSLTEPKKMKKKKQYRPRTTTQIMSEAVYLALIPALLYALGYCFTQGYYASFGADWIADALPHSALIRNCVNPLTTLFLVALITALVLHLQHQWTRTLYVIAYYFSVYATLAYIIILMIYDHDLTVNESIIITKILAETILVVWSLPCVLFIVSRFKKAGN